jgi:UDP-2,3-diacylglucosamine pyrophosphatase LpxH
VSAIRIASDWHLGPASPPHHRRLALAFLARARADRAEVILNGDVFDNLFAGAAAERSQPEVVELMAGLERDGLLRRTSGNHDPEVPSQRLVLEVTGIGRVLVAHGHALDPINSSAIGRLGDGISRRFGHLALVRGAARLAEVTALALAGPAMIGTFRRRCLAALEREGFTLGVFGHVHQAHLVPGDRYANAGWLGGRLEYLELDEAGPRLQAIEPGPTPGVGR